MYARFFYFFVLVCCLYASLNSSSSVFSTDQIHQKLFNSCAIQFEVIKEDFHVVKRHLSYIANGHAYSAAELAANIRDINMIEAQRNAKMSALIRIAKSCAQNDVDILKIKEFEDTFASINQELSDLATKLEGKLGDNKLSLKATDLHITLQEQSLLLKFSFEQDSFRAKEAIEKLDEATRYSAYNETQFEKVLADFKEHGQPFLLKCHLWASENKLLEAEIKKQDFKFGLFMHTDFDSSVEDMTTKLCNLAVKYTTLVNRTVENEELVPRQADIAAYQAAYQKQKSKLGLVQAHLSFIAKKSTISVEKDFEHSCNVIESFLQKACQAIDKEDLKRILLAAAEEVLRMERLLDEVKKSECTSEIIAKCEMRAQKIRQETRSQKTRLENMEAEDKKKKDHTFSRRKIDSEDNVWNKGTLPLQTHVFDRNERVKSQPLIEFSNDFSDDLTKFIFRNKNEPAKPKRASIWPWVIGLIILAILIVLIVFISRKKTATTMTSYSQSTSLNYDQQQKHPYPYQSNPPMAMTQQSPSSISSNVGYTSKV